MATMRISAEDAARDFEAMLLRIRAGDTFVIEKESLPVAVVAPPALRARRLSEVVADLRQDEAAMVEAPVLDPQLADIVEERIRNRKPRDSSRWA